MTEIDLTHKVIEEVISYFDGDLQKSEKWFRNVHPYLTVSPLSMILAGRVDKLQQYIANLKDGNLS